MDKKTITINPLDLCSTKTSERSECLEAIYRQIFKENRSLDFFNLDAFGEDTVPTRRSFQLFSSKQCTPALPKEQSIKYYTGPGNIEQFEGGYGSVLKWEGKMPPAPLRKAGAVLTVAGVIEITRIIITTALAALSTGSF